MENFMTFVKLILFVKLFLSYLESISTYTHERLKCMIRALKSLMCINIVYVYYIVLRDYYL